MLCCVISMAKLNKDSKLINGLLVNMVSHMNKINFILPFFQTIGRLRSRIADQLLNELDAPDHHETLIKLKELAREKAGH